MRYMGYLGDVAMQTGPALTTALDSMSDTDAEAVVDAVEASSVGKNRKLMHYGIGAIAGLVVGVVAAKLIGK